MTTHSCCACATIAIVATALCFTTATASAQDSTTSFAGPPKQIDEMETPAGIGFNQPGGELSATALEQAAIGNPTVHYHYHSAPQPKGSTATAAPSDAEGAAEQHEPPATTTPPGYAPNTYVAPIANMPTTSWHLYRGNIGVAVGGNFRNALSGNALCGSTNFHIPNNGMSGYSPSPDNVAYGSGAFIGDWDPYANGGTGSIQGFD